MEQQQVMNRDALQYNLHPGWACVRLRCVPMSSPGWDEGAGFRWVDVPYMK